MILIGQSGHSKGCYFSYNILYIILLAFKFFCIFYVCNIVVLFLIVSTSKISVKVKECIMVLWFSLEVTELYLFEVTKTEFVFPAVSGLKIWEDKWYTQPSTGPMTPQFTMKYRLPLNYSFTAFFIGTGCSIVLDVLQKFVFSYLVFSNFIALNTLGLVDFSQNVI